MADKSIFWGPNQSEFNFVYWQFEIFTILFVEQLLLILVKMNFLIKIWAQGNPGNILMMYLSALKIRKHLGYGDITNVKIPIFGIDLPDIRLAGWGLHNTAYANGRQAGYVPAPGLAHAVRHSDAKFISLEGYCQHVKNFPTREELDYEQFFSAIPNGDGGGDDELVINIRGGEILRGIHQDYTLLPPEYYYYLVAKTGKKPIFYGQLDESPYMTELRSFFPHATFIQSRGVREDFDFLRKSKHIVLCVSTFSWMAAWMSNATTIHFPIAGVLNPMQHTTSMLLPLDDPRYKFYMFPVYYGTHVDQYRDYLDPVRTTWQPMEPDKLREIVPDGEMYINDYIRSLNIEEYIEYYPEKSSVFDLFGNIGIYNDYMNNGFFDNRAAFKLERGFYTRTYHQVGLDMSCGRIKSERDHYARIGQYMGLKRMP
ncbi:Hypothetical protein GbCGDNIH3_1502 [Granulibacter bethesdensis]|uniref:Uncharacterized protein n=1 Tax=Granulibacter bethesdensis TaxID=364410 RepID=A0AAN1E639_9PROT|nr:hypothetical protein [Granulibacter bethesdensis]APG30468.1 Hypothetical protein GbCGDNIH3_1502 [Granulibacter bethesdensis]